jgi:hypothetical protein
MRTGCPAILALAAGLGAWSPSLGALDVVLYNVSEPLRIAVDAVQGASAKALTVRYQDRETGAVRFGPCPDEGLTIPQDCKLPIHVEDKDIPEGVLATRFRVRPEAAPDPDPDPECYLLLQAFRFRDGEYGLGVKALRGLTHTCQVVSSKPGPDGHPRFSIQGFLPVAGTRAKAPLPQAAGPEPEAGEVRPGSSATASLAERDASKAFQPQGGATP